MVSGTYFIGNGRLGTNNGGSVRSRTMPGLPHSSHCQLRHQEASRGRVADLGIGELNTTIIAPGPRTYRFQIFNAPSEPADLFDTRVIRSSVLERKSLRSGEVFAV